MLSKEKKGKNERKGTFCPLLLALLFMWQEDKIYGWHWYTHSSPAMRNTIHVNDQLNRERDTDSQSQKRKRKKNQNMDQVWLKGNNSTPVIAIVLHKSLQWSPTSWEKWLNSKSNRQPHTLTFFNPSQKPSTQNEKPCDLTEIIKSSNVTYYSPPQPFKTEEYYSMLLTYRLATASPGCP